MGAYMNLICIGCLLVILTNKAWREKKIDYCYSYVDKVSSWIWSEWNGFYLKKPYKEKHVKIFSQIHIRKCTTGRDIQIQTPNFMCHKSHLFESKVNCSENLFLHKTIQLNYNIWLLDYSVDPNTELVHYSERLIQPGWLSG